MKRIVRILFLLCFLMVLIAGCGKQNIQQESSTEEHTSSEEEKCTEDISFKKLNTEPLDAIGMKREDIVVDIPETNEEKQFIMIADLHIGIVSEEVLEKETVESRILSYSKWDEKTSADHWKQMVPALNETNADGILLGGDLLDFASVSNLTELKNGTDQLKIPFMYIKADHDVENYYCDPAIRENTNQLHDKIVPNLDFFTFDEEAKDGKYFEGQMLQHGNDEVLCWEYDDFMIVGMNFTTSQISSTALETFKNLYSKGKAIVLMVHVPLNSRVDQSLELASKKVWGNRNLSWGKDCYYYPDQNTAEFLNLIFEEDSQVKEVLSGHLHFYWKGDLVKGVHQHVISPAFEGYYTVITVK